MANSASRNFDIPSGFTLEEVNGQLYLEDLDEDDELWLIRMPCDIELSALDKKKIFLSDNLEDTNIKDIKTERGKLLEYYVENCEIPNTCVVLPQKNNGQLHSVKKVFKGTVLISEGLNLGDDAEIKSENETELEEISHNSIHEPKEKKRKKKERQSQFNFDASDLNYETEDAEKIVSSDMQKKHKKKERQSQFNFDTSDLNYETEDAENIVSPDTRKKRSKKKRSDSCKESTSENVEIKEEPVMDWDGFPPCSSQKY